HADSSTGNLVVYRLESGTEYASLTLVRNAAAASDLQIATSGAFGGTVQSNVRLYVKGSDTTSSNFALAAVDSGGSPIINSRNDRAVQFPGVGTTASAANAFLDNSASNNLLRSTSSMAYKCNVNPLTVAQAAAILDFQAVTFNSLASIDDAYQTRWGLVSEQVE